MLEGGIEAWRDAGCPIVRDVKQPIEIMRQVQIVAGSLVAVGTALGVFVHPGFLAVPGFVGAALPLPCDGNLRDGPHSLARPLESPGPDLGQP